MPLQLYSDFYVAITFYGLTIQTIKRNPLNETTLRYINANLNKNRCLVVKNRLLIINGVLRFDVQSLNWLLILVIRDI